ncbi:hypothetical protein [Sphingomonas solaris]|uniref:Uncharacterized protein n=1 Tax=Alterirhizorhabdus solaris TaxID=2529389 RepID=A0A558R7V9_9SPHN|nr:hypothetical protein [Sphingomonas solaris]TVV75392.1 hypothetical protein FOY91_07355 [Sphingomonas solaris]
MSMTASAACSTSAPPVPGRPGRIFGDPDAGPVHAGPRPAPGCGLFGRRDGDPPTVPPGARAYTARRRPPRRI